MDYPAAPNQEQLSELLGQVLAANKPAELESYFKRYLSSAACVQDLATQMIHNQTPAIRQLAAILLRKKVLIHWDVLSAEVRTAFKSAVIDRISNEPEGLVRKNVASLAAHLGTHVLATWPELLEFISVCLENTAQAKEMGIYLLSELLEDPETCKFLTPHQERLIQVISQSLSDRSTRDIRRYALKALGHYAVNSDDRTVSAGLIALIPTLLTVMDECFSEGDEEMIVFTFQVFDDLLESEQDFGPNLEHVVRVATEKIASDPNLRLTTRECAMDFLETLVDVKPKLLISNPATINYLLENLFKITLECEDDPDEATPVDMAFRLLDTLAISLPNKTIYPLIMQKVAELQQSALPRAKRSAIIALGVAAEGCADFMKQSLDGIVTTLVAALADPDAGVREAGGLALGYAAEHLKPDILERHEQIMMPLLESVDSSQSRVKHKIIFAIDTFCENFDEDIDKYHHVLFPKLVGVIVNDPDPKTKRVALSALISTISASEQKLSAYFMELVQLLGGILQSDQEVSIRATALQCLGNLAAASTVEEFTPYINDAVGVATNYLASDNLEMREAGFAFFYSLCRLMKSQVEPYADHVIAEALKSCEANQTPPIPDDDDDSSDEDDEEESQVRTAFIDEKTAALHSLGHFAKAVPLKILPHLEFLTKTIERMLAVEVENIRMQVVTTTQQLVEALYQINQAEQFWLVHMLHRWIELLKKDSSKEVVCRVLEGFEELIKEVGPQVIPDTFMESLIGSIDVLLCENARCQREGDEQEGDHDEELMGDVADLVQELARGWKDAWSPCFERLLPSYSRFLKPTRNPRDRVLFTGSLADILLCLPTVAQKFANDFYQLAMLNLRDSDTTLYRNSLYYLGALFEQSPYANVSEILALVQPFFTGSFDEDTEDNAAACVCRIIYTAGSALPLDQVLPVVFTKLPLKSDLSETTTVLKAMVFLYENGLDMTQYHGVCLQTMIEALIVQMQEPDKYKLDATLIAATKRVILTLQAAPDYSHIAARLTPDSQALLAQLLSS